VNTSQLRILLVIWWAAFVPKCTAIVGLPEPVEGTLVAAFLMRDEILLCSDGRVVSPVDGSVVRNDWSKVHQLTPKIGLLTVGRYLPGLILNFRSKWGNRTASSVREAVDVLRLALEEEWRGPAARPGRAGGDVRAFVFVAGFDPTGQARLYYLDNQTNPPFRIQERTLFADGRDLEIAAMSHGSGIEQDPSAAIVRHFATIRRQQPTQNVREQLLASFDAAKGELGLTDSQIGGRTFAASIDRTKGFQLLTR
jgi:hypothetical protein